MKTHEQQFLDAWSEFGFAGSDIVREYRFHPTRKWRFDFAFPSRRVAIEIDGRGRHQTVTGVRSDCEKHNYANDAGWAVLRLPTSDIRAKDQSGSPRIETFIELLCKILTNREYDSNTGIIQQRVEELPEVSTTQGSSPPRSVRRVNTVRSDVGGGSTGKNRKQTG